MTEPKAAPAVDNIPLPTWTDAASVTSYVTSVVALVVGIIAAIHPGFTEPAFVPSIAGSVGLLVAGAAQIFNFVTHRSIQKAAILSGYTLD